jgi:phosphoribosylglycinamide formyltransferase 1
MPHKTHPAFASFKRFMKKRLVVLISGGGSNLQSLIDACEAADFPAHIVAVMSNRSDAYGLVRAQNHQIATQIVDHKQFDTRESFDAFLQTAIDEFAPDFVILAGFMRILTPEFVNHYLGRLINIHPSLLPLYPGLHTHQRALDAGDLEQGATVHFVTAELDGGPAIIQAKVPILSGDTADALAKRVLTVEHKIYPLAVKWLCEGKIIFTSGKAWRNDKLISPQGILYQENEVF